MTAIGGPATTQVKSQLLCSDSQRLPSSPKGSSPVIPAWSLSDLTSAHRTPLTLLRGTSLLWSSLWRPIHASGPLHLFSLIGITCPRFSQGPLSFLPSLPREAAPEHPQGTPPPLCRALLLSLTPGITCPAPKHPAQLPNHPVSPAGIYGPGGLGRSPSLSETGPGPR